METVSPPIYAALLGGALLCLQIILMLTVGTYRSNSGKGVGVADDMKLERLVRRHGNLAENAAIFVTVFALYELLFGQTWIALIIGIVFFLARSLLLWRSPVIPDHIWSTAEELAKNLFLCAFPAYCSPRSHRWLSGAH
ncbi:MAG: MAPEG family protein [Pseudomonadota bacterium]